MVLFNNLSRTIPKGILIGQDSKPLVLRLDDDFDKIYHYDAPCTLHRIEVGHWACFSVVPACLSNLYWCDDESGVMKYVCLLYYVNWLPGVLNGLTMF